MLVLFYPGRRYHIRTMYIKVFVTPGAKKERVEEKGDTLRISVREPAAQNFANTRVRELVALRCKVPVGKVRILTGHRSRTKMISVNSPDVSVGEPTGTPTILSEERRL